jgi:hypothetical protein
MAGVTVPAYKQFWKDKRPSLKSEYNAIISTYPDASSSMQQLLKVLSDIEDLASYTPASIGESKEWAKIISSAEENRKNCCKAIQGKTLFSILYGTYTVMLNELKSALKASTQTEQTKQGDGFKEVRSRKRHNTKEAAYTSKKATLPRATVEVTTRNFFAPLQTMNMDTDVPGTESNAAEETVPGKLGRPPPIVLTSATNFIQLQKQLKDVAKQIFKFCTTRNGTRVITKDMVDYQSVKTHFETNNHSYYTFYPKSQKLIKAVIRHLPQNTPVEDILDGLVDLSFDVISIKQMSTARRSPEGTTSITLPLFLVTLPRMAKSQDIFKLSNH